MISLLRDHLRSHPAAEIREGVKFLYQSEFGGGHMISDHTMVLERLRNELAECGVGDDPLSEPLGNGLCRINLRALRGKLAPETLSSMFIATANSVQGSLDSFKIKLSALYSTSFSHEDTEKYLVSYKANGYPAVSHSEAYRKAYSPAYRVIKQYYADFFELFSIIDSLLSNSDSNVIVGIDGDCGSGKTTLGELLRDTYGANLFRADDYFLPPEIRTAKRLSEPGGNMHRERLLSEVLEPISTGSFAVTRRFDCSVSALLPRVEHTKKRLNIIEGSYCLHPLLRNYYTVRVFLKTSPENQKARIVSRNGEEAYKRFESQWIPMEKSYFSACNVEKCADIVFET